MPNTETGFPAEAYSPIHRWPGSVEPRQLSLHPVANSSVSTSPFTGAVQAEALPGTRWKLAASFGALGLEQSRQVRALITRLRGCSGRFYFLAEPGAGVIAPQPPEDNLAGVVTEGPRFSSISSGRLETTGWPMSTGVLVYRAGDYISIDDAKGLRRLFMLLEDAVAGISGSVAFTLAPSPLGLATSVGAAIHHGGHASGLYYLDDDSQGQIAEEPGRDYSLSISASEFHSGTIFKRVL